MFIPDWNWFQIYVPTILLFRRFWHLYTKYVIEMSNFIIYFIPSFTPE